MSGTRLSCPDASVSPFRTDWFEVKELDHGVFLVSEPGHVNSFLITGSASAVLFDTGLGVANIRTVAEAVTDLPMLAVNSHYHFDHTGGNRFFDGFAIHEVGAELVREPSPPELASAYMEYTARLLRAWGPYREADDLYFHLLTAERTIRQLPDGFDPAGYQVLPSVPSRLLREGDVLDLGDRTLRVMHTPGHSPDCICLFDERNGLLFGGDTINAGPIYAQASESNLEDFARSTARLAEMGDQVSRVFVCHFLRYDEDGELLREIADGFGRLVGGDDLPARSSVDCFNDPVREVCFERFSVFVAPDPVAEGA